MLITDSDMFPAASQAVIRLLVHFRKKKFMVSSDERLDNAPINIMPHYPPYGQMAGNIGALTEGGCPYSRAFDYL